MKKMFPALLLSFLAICSTACQASGTEQPSAASSTASTEPQIPAQTEEYRMAPGPASQAFLFAEEGTPCYGIPFDSPVHGTLSNQLVQVEATALAGECPECGKSEWALIYWGEFDAAIDTLCWVRLCDLRPYTEEDMERITYPLRVREGLTLQIREKDVPSETLGDARATKREEGSILLNWVGGNSCEVQAGDVIIPDPDTVNSIRDDGSDWDAVFGGQP